MKPYFNSRKQHASAAGRASLITGTMLGAVIAPACLDEVVKALGPN